MKHAKHAKRQTQKQRMKAASGRQKEEEGGGGRRCWFRFAHRRGGQGGGPPRDVAATRFGGCSAALSTPFSCLRLRFRAKTSKR
eukprot:5956039-Pleurochrysis_carterae.AAC.2